MVYVSSECLFIYNMSGEWIFRYNVKSFAKLLKVFDIAKYMV